jgi:hypothetical protein
MEQTNINVMVDAGDSMQRAVLAGSIEQALDKDAFSPETEARQLLEVMAAAGVIPEETARTLIGATALPEIVDAELIEEDEE